ncbi:unnamed protein product [Acanthoscelides obtectus]|uniref:Uncharacterized protein n=1 Tax=Acanthoscelides obtectus TaxID=200917 RepID=A0A9P0M3W2_ACAOB|nr:unnamed protein product [Acanthoscelides obtectus]
MTHQNKWPSLKLRSLKGKLVNDTQSWQGSFQWNCGWRLLLVLLNDPAQKTSCFGTTQNIL